MPVFSTLVTSPLPVLGCGRCNNDPSGTDSAGRCHPGPGDTNGTLVLRMPRLGATVAGPAANGAAGFARWPARGSGAGGGCLVSAWGLVHLFRGFSLFWRAGCGLQLVLHPEGRDGHTDVTHV